MSTTGSVLTIHGIATGVSPDVLSFRNMLEASDFERILSSGPPFVSLDRALAGDGVALTIDDAIRGGADAALMARRLGHDVTLFVNPGHVESGLAYAWLTVDAALDSMRGWWRMFDGSVYPVRTVVQRRRLRRDVKRRLCEMTSEPERQALVRAIARDWKVGHIQHQPHTAILTRQDLVALRDAGVDLQNHGFWHHEHRSLTARDSAAEVREGRRWLSREIGVDARYFAAPFGEALPPADTRLDCDVWLTLMDEQPKGWHTGTVFNRETLDIPRTTCSEPPVNPLRRWVSRLRRL